METKKCKKLDIQNVPKTSNEIIKKKVLCDKENKENNVKMRESAKLQTSSNHILNGKSNDKEGQLKSSKLPYPKYSPPVLIPSVSQKCQLSAIPTHVDNILHPELIVSPRSVDVINRRGIVSLGRRQKLIIGSIGKVKSNTNQKRILMSYENYNDRNDDLIF